MPYLKTITDQYHSADDNEQAFFDRVFRVIKVKVFIRKAVSKKKDKRYCGGVKHKAFMPVALD